MMNEIVLVSVVFSATTIFILAIAYLINGMVNSESAQVKKRFETINPNYSYMTQDQRLALLKEENEWAKSDIFQDFPPLLNLPQLFAQAGMKTSVEKWLIMTASASAGVGFLVWYMQHQIMLSIIAALGTSLLFYMNILMTRKKRLAKFEASLAQALEIIGRSLRAGHPLSMGIYMVSTELPDPIGPEFGRVFHQNQMGIPIDEALKGMTQRVPLIDLRFFVLSIMIHNQTGGDLAEIMDNLAKVIRERFRVLGQVKALTAEGRLSGWVLSLLPIFVFGMILTINREYALVLLETERGQKMMWVAIGMQIIGVFIIRKIVNIKV